MKNIFSTLLLVALITGCQSAPRHKDIHPPRATPPFPWTKVEAESTTPPLPGFSMARTARVVVVNPPTVPVVYAWNWSGVNLDHYVFLIGTNSGGYTTVRVIGIEQRYTNLVPITSIRSRNYAAVKAALKDGRESEPSNEVLWPKMTAVATNVLLSWNAPAATVLTSSDVRKPLSQWAVLTNVSASNIILRAHSTAYFAVRSDRPTTLKIQRQ